MAGTNRSSSEDENAVGGEARALELIASIVDSAPEGEVWIGDDSAVVSAPVGDGESGQFDLLTIDTVVEGIHADLGLVGLDDFGFKAVSTAVSDIAAMGGSPKRILVSVAGPPMTDIRSIYGGIREAAALFGTDVVGGELTTSPTLVISVAVTGRMSEGSPVLRSGARPGDQMFVTGAVGAAAAGLRVLRDGHPGSGSVKSESETEASLIRAHSRPLARIREGRAAQLAGASAMIDLSDGFAAGVRDIASASRVGVVLDAVPIADGATEKEALCGGDDYELLFTASDPAAVYGSFDSADLPRPIPVGRCTEEVSQLLIGGSPLPDCGWEHPFQGSSG